ncbi:hypothetical protein ACN23B_13960 [Anabaena sp. FACHB-709]|nr:MULTISPECIES: hypothetical protein [Nostocaceae]
MAVFHIQLQQNNDLVPRDRLQYGKAIATRFKELPDQKISKM